MRVAYSSFYAFIYLTDYSSYFLALVLSRQNAVAIFLHIIFLHIIFLQMLHEVRAIEFDDVQKGRVL